MGEVHAICEIIAAVGITYPGENKFRDLKFLIRFFFYKKCDFDRKILILFVYSGPSFVDMVNTKQKDNPEYAFLRGGEGSDFWKWTLYNQLCRQRQPVEAQKIPIDLLQGWSGILSTLKPTQDSISSAQAWFASRPEHFMQMALMVGQRAMSGACPDFPGSLSLVFLVNDIFMKAMAQNNLRIVVPTFLQMLQNGSNPLIEIFKSAGHHAAGRPDRVQQLMNIVNIWRQHGIIDQQLIDILINHVYMHPSSLQHQPPPPPGQPHMQHGPPIAMLARQSGGAQRPVVAHPMAVQANNGPHLFQQHPSQIEMQPYAHPGGQGAFRPELRFPTPALGAAGAQVPIETIQAKPESIEPAFDTFSFPPGLIPYLVEDKLKTDPPYSPLSPLDIEKCPVPPPPNEDEYLKARLDKFYAELAVRYFIFAV